MPISSQQQFPPDTYGQVLRERLGQLVSVPGDWIRNQMHGVAQGAALNPNARPGTPDEAQSAGTMDPLQKQQMIQAILARQQGGQMPAQAVDQRQLILQEAQRRGIPVPPDSPLLQGQGQPQPPVDPNNPAGIQF